MLEAWVYSWDQEANHKKVEELRERCGIDTVHSTSHKAHEPQLLNCILRNTTNLYVLIVHSGIEILHDDFAQVMMGFMLDNDDAGLISPNREGEPRSLAPPKRWWYDGIAGLFFRCDIRFDEDFIFSQWADIDIGLEYQHQGFTVWRDPRVSVRYTFRDYGGRSAFYHAYSARNKLLMDIKWFGVGRDKWHGVDGYNNQMPETHRIPTMFELAWYSQQQLALFAESVESELHWILTGAGLENPNLAWENPVVLAREG